MQYNGMKCDSEELAKFGISLKERLNQLTNEIYEIAGEEFNINSTKQLGVILFEKLGLKAKKKTKSGYSTSEEVLNSLIDDNPIIEKILEYRGLMKLNSTYRIFLQEMNLAKILKKHLNQKKDMFILMQIILK